MSHFERSLRSQFFLTGPRPCPYLPDRRERKLFTNLVGGRAEALHDELAQLGFRRSQNIAYRPACQGCSACVSTRVPAARFTPSRSQRRVIKRNGDLVRRMAQPWPTDAHYRLFKRYLRARHAEGGMVEMDALDFAAMVEDSPVRTYLIEYYAPAGSVAAPDGASKEDALAENDLAEEGALAAEAEEDALEEGLAFDDALRLDERSLDEAAAPHLLTAGWEAALASEGEFSADQMLASACAADRAPAPDQGSGPGGGELIAACVTDVLKDGLSLVYSFFDPREDRRSLGRYMILDHIEITKELGLDYVYLGYWVKGSRKMDYKIEFKPTEILKSNRWRPL